MKVEIKPRVQMQELGVFLRTIEIDFKPQNNAERAQLITEYFPVLCLEEDVDKYEMLSNIQEDYELESRRESYFQSIGKINPFN